MIWDVNQTEFISDKQRVVWQCGTHIVPLEVSLADVEDEETREGCMQIYDCTMEILVDMYTHPDEYKERPRWYTADYLVWMICGSRPIKHHSDEYQRFISKISVFGFTYDNDIGCWTNERYPLFCEYFPRFIEAAKERKQCLGGYVARLDFRLFAPKIKLTLDDLLRPLSDSERAYCLEMHHYAVSKGLKVQMKDPYVFRYIYKKLYSLVLSNDPLGVSVCIRLDNGKHVYDQVDRFLDVVSEQPDCDELTDYIKGGIRACDACGGSKKPNERCGMWVEIQGARRLVSMCQPSISKYRRGKHNMAYTEEDIQTLKRMLDIRLLQVDRYMSEQEQK